MPSRRRIAIIAVMAAIVLALGGGAAAIAVVANQSGENEQSDATPERTTTKPKTTTIPTPIPKPEPAPEPEPEPAPEPVPDPQPPAPEIGSIDDPGSLNVVVNKQRPLNPTNWVPGDLAYPEVPNSSGQPLRWAAAVALEQMYAEAAAAGVPFNVTSGFRSYDTQVWLFNSFVANYGVAAAEATSARPGHSEHQTGLAVDITECSGCSLSEAFGSTPQGLWTRENAYRFGFILRYDQGQQPVVGYAYEPWHFRYVGVEIAADMRNRGIVNLEDYFGLPPAPTYLY